MSDEYEERPWAHRINRSAWQPRHKYGVDGRLWAIILPLLVCGMVGVFGRFVMILSVVLAVVVWFVGKLLWAYDPYLIDKVLIEHGLPRWGGAVRFGGPNLVEQLRAWLKKRMGT